jgi:hypothetical protein
MSILNCPKCKATLALPFKLSSQVKKDIAALVKQNRFLAIDLLRKNSAIPFSEAKLIVLHLTEQSGDCHGCDTQQEKAEFTFCPDCDTLNLNWSNE